MGIDYGDVRTGIAVSDSLGILACGVGTYKAKGRRELVSILLTLAEEHRVDEFVLGNPINMNGTVGERSEKVQRLADELAVQTGKPVHLFDERCTTMAAHQILNMTDTRGKKRKDVVDTLSAQIILQNYMDSHKNDMEKGS
jgi:putative Holliday junction resolvase